MACCLFSTKSLSKPVINFYNHSPRYSLKWGKYQKKQIFTGEIVFNVIISNFAAILSGGRWLKTLLWIGTWRVNHNNSTGAHRASHASWWAIIQPSMHMKTAWNPMSHWNSSRLPGTCRQPCCRRPTIDGGPRQGNCRQNYKRCC